jgi:hypothetical protein
MDNMDNTLTPKQSPRFACKLCVYECYKHSDYIRHCKTKKHQKNIDNNKNNKKVAIKEYKCKLCNKSYQHLSGLSKHKKKCVDIIEEEQIIKNDDKDEMNTIVNLVKQFKETSESFFKYQEKREVEHMELLKQLIAIMKSGK